MNNTTLIVIVVLGACLLAGFKELSRRRGKVADESATERMPYAMKNSVLTKNEYALYQTLKPIAAEQGLDLLVKVRLADFLYVQKGTEKYQTWLNKITSKHIDFLLCDKNIKPLLAVELDDSTHDRPSRAERDSFVDEVYRTIGLDVLHARGYKAEGLKAEILQRLNPPPPIGADTAAVEP